MIKHLPSLGVALLLATLQAGGETLKGFNSKWCYIPSPDSPHYEIFLGHVKSLRPQLLRYPGGTMTHRWDWQSGRMTQPRKGVFINPVGNLTQLATRTQTDVVFVLDIVNRSLNDQIEMLKASKLPVRYIELGNEIYAGHYKKQFPSGKEYAERVNQWVPELRRQFPEAEFSVSLLGRNPQGKRLKNWNQLVVDNLKKIDAYTYHIYVKNGVTVEQRIKEYEQQLITKDGIDIWITEYGIQDERKLTDTEQTECLRKLDALRNYVENNGAIALCHILTTSDTPPKSDNSSAIRYGGETLNPVGIYFKKETR